MSILRQEKALAKMLENGGNMSKAMIDAGYSPNTAKTSTKLTRSKTWQSLMEKHFPDSSLALLHKQLLAKQEILIVSGGSKEGSHLEWTGQPHTDSLKALDIAYKIKGKLKEGENPIPSAPTTVIIINYGNRNDNPSIPVRATNLPNTTT